MSKLILSNIFYLFWYLVLSLTVSSCIFAMDDFSQADGQQLAGAELSIDAMLDRAEIIMHTDIEEVDPLLLMISRNSRPLDQLQRHRLMLLQANRLILKTNFEQADDILGQLMSQKTNTATMIRAIYFRARIAQNLNDFERAFLYLYRLDQYPRPSISIQQQFNILSLATNLYAKAHAFSQASGYAQRALSLARQSKSLRLICYALRTKSDVYYIAKDYSGLNKAANESIEACTEADEKVALAASYINLSHWHREQQNYQQQRQFIGNAIALYQQEDFIVSMNSANLLLAEGYLLDNKAGEAQKLLDSIFSDVERLNINDDLQLAYRIKAELSEKLGQPDEAMYYLKKYLAMQNSNNKLIRKIHVAYLKNRFNSKIDQQSGVIDKIEQQNVELIARAEKLTTLMIVISSLLLLSVLFYCFTFYRHRKSISLTEHNNLDELTQLYNVSYGFGVARQLLETSRNSNNPLGVVCIDLDYMSAVNNSFSHDFGDILLQAFANKINCLVTDYGIVIRHSGDYFIAVVPNLSDDELSKLVVKIHQCLDGLTIDRQKIVVSCSIGWTIQHTTPSIEVSENLSLLIGQAAQALSQAKFNGRNQWVRYEHGKIDESLAESDYRSLTY